MDRHGECLKMWTGSGPQSGAPKVASLPPSNEPFNENVARDHIQVAVWRNVLQPIPTGMYPAAAGLSLDDESKTRFPTTLHTDTPIVPYDLLKLVICSCSSGIPCETHIYVGAIEQTLSTRPVFCARQGN